MKPWYNCNRAIPAFSNGAAITFGKGSIDNWCVFYTDSDGKQQAFTDENCFDRLYALGHKFGYQKVYEDFKSIYDKTGEEVEPSVLQHIQNISATYHGREQKAEILFTQFYAMMIAEQHRYDDIGKIYMGKSLKCLAAYYRLILHKILHSEGVPWQDLMKDANSRGIYLS